MLEKTRHIWKRRVQARIFERAGIQDYLDEREKHLLEDHMGFRGQYDEHRRFQIDELKKLGLKPSHSVMEIGCGPATAAIPVISYLDGGNYVGVDVRGEVLNEAWKQIGKHDLAAKNPTLLRSDNFGDEYLGERQFDFIWAFSVLYHLSDQILDRYFAAVSKRVGTMAVANVQTTHDSSTWLQFPFLKRSIKTYESAAAKHGLKTKELGTLQQRGFRLDSDEKANIILQFTAGAD